MPPTSGVRTHHAMPSHHLGIRSTSDTFDTLDLERRTALKTRPGVAVGISFVEYTSTHTCTWSIHLCVFVRISLHRHIYIYIYPYIYIYIYIYYTHVWSYMCKWWLVHCKQTCACWRPTTSMGTLILIPSHLGVQKNGRRFRLFTNTFGKIWVDLPFAIWTESTDYGFKLGIEETLSFSRI